MTSPSHRDVIDMLCRCLHYIFLCETRVCYCFWHSRRRSCVNKALFIDLPRVLRMTYGRAAWRRGRIPSKSEFWPRIGIRTGRVHSSTGLSVPSLFRWPISNIPASRGAEASKNVTSVGVVWSRSRVVRCCAVFSFHMRCSAPSLCHRACIFCSNSQSSKSDDYSWQQREVLVSACAERNVFISNTYVSEPNVAPKCAVKYEAPCCLQNVTDVCGAS